MDTSRKKSKFSESLLCFRFLAALVTVLPLLGGCLVLPVPESMQFYGGRRIISEEDLVYLERGKVTRADVLLKFGEPDVVSPDERKFAYKWHMAKAVWLIFAANGYSGGMLGGDIPEMHLIILEFDDAGVLGDFSVDEFYLSSMEYKMREAGFDYARPYQSGDDIVLETDHIQPVAGERILSLGIKTADWQDLRPGADAEPQLLGEAGYWNLKMGRIVTPGPLTDVLRRLVHIQIGAMGGELAAEDPDWTLSGEIIDLHISNSSNSFTIKTSIHLLVRVHFVSTGMVKESLVREYEIDSKVHRLVLNESIQDAFDDCLQQFLNELSRDLAQLAE